MKKLLILSIVILTVIFISGCEEDSYYLYDVQFIVTGTASTGFAPSADISFADEYYYNVYDVENLYNVTLPWYFDFTGETGDYLYLAARGSDPNLTSLTVEIYIGGTLVAADTATGANAFAELIYYID